MQISEERNKVMVNINEDNWKKYFVELYNDEEEEEEVNRVSRRSRIMRWREN